MLTKIKNAFTWLGGKIVIGLKAVTYFISKSVTAVVAVGGALCGITTIHGDVNAYRPGIALMIFIFGLPFGLIVFGADFSILIWLGIVVTVLFFMNLHNAWEVILSLKHGGLDYIMASQAVAAAEGITPDQEDMRALYAKVKKLNVDLKTNQLRGRIFEDGIFQEGTERLIPAPQGE